MNFLCLDDRQGDRTLEGRPRVPSDFRQGPVPSKSKLLRYLREVLRRIRRGALLGLLSATLPRKSLLSLRVVLSARLVLELASECIGLPYFLGQGAGVELVSECIALPYFLGQIALLKRLLPPSLWPADGRGGDRPPERRPGVRRIEAFPNRERLVKLFATPLRQRIQENVPLAPRIVFLAYPFHRVRVRAYSK